MWPSNVKEGGLLGWHSRKSSSGFSAQPANVLWSFLFSVWDRLCLCIPPLCNLHFNYLPSQLNCLLLHLHSWGEQQHFMAQASRERNWFDQKYFQANWEANHPHPEINKIFIYLFFPNTCSIGKLRSNLDVFTLKSTLLVITMLTF